MRLGTYLALGLLLIALKVCADEKLSALKVGNEVFSNVTVTAVTPTDIYFTYPGGMANAKLKKLGPELQKHFHYNTTNAVAVEKKQIEANAQYHAAHPASHPALPPSNEDRSPPASAGAERTYDLRFKIDLKQGGPQKKPVWLLIPQMNTDQQTFSFEVSNAVSYQTRHVGIHDYIEVVQKPGEALYVDGKLTLKPFCLGARLNDVPAGECPEDLKPYLTKFLWWDPELPEVQAIAKTVKGPTSAQTVQNILNWFRKNIRFDSSITNDPALGPLGTILKLRYGGCFHNSGLFITLCRAAGVPACVANGNKLPLDDKPFDFMHNSGHGYAEVYINSIGWVPVEPMDPNSLRLFTARHAYVAVGPSNRPPEKNYSDRTIKYEGQEYRFYTIQHSEEISGRLVEVKLVE